MSFSNFLNKIIEFFQELLFSSTPGYQQKKELKAIFRETQIATPPLYSEDKILLKGFPTALHQLSHFLQPLKEILTKTIASQDEKTANKYQSSFIDQVLLEAQQKQKKTFTFIERKLDIEKDENLSVEEKIQKQTEAFNLFFKIYESDIFKKQAAKLEMLFALADLCAFDFNTLLGSFDHNFKQPTKNLAKPDFQKVYIDEVMEQLLDLDFLLNKIKFDEQLTTILCWLAMASSSTPQEEDPNEIFERISKIITLLSKNKLGNNMLLNIIRHAQGDPKFTEKPTKQKSNFIVEYMDQLVKDFSNDSKRLTIICNKNKLANLIERTFNNQLLPIEGYTEELSKALEDVSDLSFEWPTPLKIIKTFTKTKFLLRYKPFLQNLLVSGTFLNKEFQTNLSTTYYYCESLQGKIANFEAQFQTQGAWDSTKIKNLIAELKTGNNEEAPLKKIVLAANEAAGDLVKKSAASFETLFSLIGIILHDIRKSNSANIENLREVTQNSKSVLSFSLIEQERSLYLNFLKIIKAYTTKKSKEKNKKPISEKELS